jgi:SagB-type dehydrogenase family enzyme
LRYRRSPCLVSYWQGEQLVLDNYASGARIAASALIVDLLSALDRWQTLDSLASRLTAYDSAALTNAVERLHELSLVQRSDRGPSRIEKALETWRDWSPEAAFFHLSTKNVPYSEPRVSEAMLHDKAVTEPRPSPLKRFEDAPRVPLPNANTDGALAQTLARRRTWRRFARDPVQMNQLGTLLDLTWGVQRWANIEGQGKLALKTSPSGGARHNLEAYVLALRVKGLVSGLYHYDPDSHALEWLAERRKLATVSTYVPRQTWYDKAAVVVFMTAVFARAQWRYGYPRAYRSVLLEAGHFCQTFCLLATSLNLAPFCTAAFAESILERDLGIDGVTESVIYACGVGTRPPGVDWAPWPDTTDVPRVVPPKSASRRKRAR